MKQSNNPLDYVTKQELIELGLTIDEIADSYKPSAGAVYMARGGEGLGKTLWVVHRVKYLVDIGAFSPYDIVGNITLRGKYGLGYQTLKGDNLRQFLWDLTHKPYRDKIVIIDEVDSEFPARSFTDKEQTEISLRLWHQQKLHNYIFMTSHKGNSADIIMHLASHYYIYPFTPDLPNNKLEYGFADALNETYDEYETYDIAKTMLIYNRQELTEDTEEEHNKIRPSQRKRIKKESSEFNIPDLDLELEWEKGLEV